MSSIFSQGRALVIGAGTDKIATSTINDARGIAAILTDIERCAYPVDQVQLLTSEQANRAGILAGLKKLADTSDTSSTVIVYFSGHGYKASSTFGKGYFLMPFGYDRDNLSETAISSQELITYLGAIQAKKLVLLLDCCYAGSIEETKVIDGLKLTKAPLPEEAINQLSDGQGRVIIASSREGELSYAGKPYSAFTLALIEALNGQGETTANGFVRVSHLAMYCGEKVPARTKGQQHPILNYEKADNFEVAYFAGGGTERKTLPFKSEDIEIEPEPGAFSATFIQTGQTINGQQFNSSTFEAPVSFSNTFDQRGSQSHSGSGDNIRVEKGDFVQGNKISTGGGAYIRGNVNNSGGVNVFGGSISNINHSPTNPNTRYTDIRFPSTISEGEIVALEVSLTLAEVKASRTAGTGQAGQVSINSLDDIRVNVNSSAGLEIVGKPFGFIKLKENADSDPIFFEIKAIATGEQSVSLSFYQNEKFARRIEIPTLVKAKNLPQVSNVSQLGSASAVSNQTPKANSTTKTETAFQQEAITLPDQSPPDADVIIHIDAIEDGNTGRTALKFQISYSIGHQRNRFVPINETITLSFNPRNHFQQIFKELTDLARKSDRAAEECQEKLREIGCNIYEQLFPQQLKQIYNRFRDSAKSMLIMSSEPWIPWELALPYDSELNFEDGFLCERYKLTRWLARGNGTTAIIPLNKPCYVIPPSNLKRGEQEVKKLSRLFDNSIKLGTKKELMSRLKAGNFDFMHFICHGSFDANQHDFTSLQLGDGDFSPSNLSGLQIEGILRNDKPFFFLNACHSGQQEFGLVGIGGWVSKLLSLGCTGFVGTLWEVDDRLAAMFAFVFYNELLNKRATFGEAFWEARRIIREEDPSNSTWLAYTLYADPMGRALKQRQQ